MRPAIAILAMTAFLAACGGDSHSAAEHETPPTTPDGVAVEVDTIPLVTTVDGTVFSRNRAEITTRMMARVTALSVDVGARVGRGDLLLRLGTDDVEANRAKAEAAALAARAARDEAARHAERLDTLYAQDVVARVQRDQARLRLTQAESQVAMAEAALTEVETAASYASIRAPFAGEVVSRHIDVGDVAAPGRPLLVIEERGPREARLSVPLDAAKGLAPGDTVTVTTLDGRSLPAPVRAVAAGADPRSKTVEVRVTLPSDWPTGVSVSARVPVGTVQAVTVPMSAVVRRGQLTGVRVVTPDGVALRWVRLGRTLDGGDRVQVLTGLNAGDEIIL
jgi:RND family efflux transporter MFP subunit